ncbi:MAG: hypothetical protein RLZZ227_3065 [Pseudomonadota bacterium]
MGTTWSVQVVAASAGHLPDGVAIKALLQRLDRQVFSPWSPDSELTQLNRSPVGVAIPVSAEMLDALVLARKMYGASRHAFDVSVGPLVNLWGFGPEPFTGVPDAVAVRSAQERVGLQALEIDTEHATVTLARPLTLDLSSIAEGYASDRVAALLLEQGFSSFLVEIGGELRAQGQGPGSSGWSVALERPQRGMREIHARLDTLGEALAVSASGDYRNFHDIDGEHYSHAIDPRSGYPITHALASVTVISDTAAAADAWSTALLVLGPEEGRAVADSEGLAAYFIMRAPRGFTHAYTPAFARYLLPTSTFTSTFTPTFTSTFTSTQASGE